jgi:hypothetical protein
VDILPRVRLLEFKDEFCIYSSCVLVISLSYAGPVYASFDKYSSKHGLAVDLYYLKRAM